MNTIHLKRLALLSLAAGVLPVLAQTTTTPATCTTAPTSITALNLERVVSLTNIASTSTPTIPTALQSAILSGALEIRQQFSYNPSTNVITITDFGAQPSSSSPTTPANILSSNIISGENFTVDKIYASCKPVPSLLITGTITQNFPLSPVGTLIGVPAAISVAYTTDSPAKVTNAVIVYAGIASIFSASANGTLTFPVSTVTPPGTTAGGPVIVVSGGLNITTAQKQIGIDASGSTSPSKSAITYSAMQVAPSSAGSTPGATTGIPQAANISPSGIPGVFLVTFGGGKGTYAFQITATDSGGSTIQTVVIDYRGN